MVGRVLRELRTKTGMTQTALAQALKIHPKSVKNWESDDSDPDAKNLCLIADYFCVSADLLLGRESNNVISLDGLSADEREVVLAMVQVYMDKCHEIKRRNLLDE